MELDASLMIDAVVAGASNAQNRTPAATENRGFADIPYELDKV